MSSQAPTTGRNGSSSSGGGSSAHGPKAIHMRIAQPRTHTEEAHTQTDGRGTPVEASGSSASGGNGNGGPAAPQSSRGSASLPSIRRVSSGASIALAGAHHSTGKIGSFSSMAGSMNVHGGGSKVGSFSSNAGGWDESPLVRPRFHSDPAEEVNLAAASSASPMLAAAAAAAATVAAAAMAAAHAAPHAQARVSAAHSATTTQHSPLAPASPASSSSSSDSSVSPRSDDGDGGFTSLVNALPHPHHHHHHAHSSRPTHFHAGLPKSIHNPQVMRDKYLQSDKNRNGTDGTATSAGAGGVAVAALDEDDIRLVDASGPVGSSSPRREEPVSAGAADALASLPIPVPPPLAHFRPEAWRWKEVDYVNQQSLLEQFFRAIETHSEVYVEHMNNPPPQPAPQPTAALQPLRPRPSLRSPMGSSASVSGSGPQSSGASTTVASASRPSTGGLPALHLSTAGSDGSSSASSSSSSSAPSPRAARPVVYPADFQPHRLQSLQMHARKDLLRKSKIVDSDMHGPGLGSTNPTETLLANLIASSGTLPASASSPPPSGALSARGHSSASHAAAAAAAAAALQASSSSGGASLPPPGLPVLPHLHTLDIRMGIHGANLAEALRRNTTLTCVDLSHNVIAEKGCTALCRNLQSHPQLRDLRLSYNILYPSCAAPLRDLLLYNRTITALDLAINKLESEGVATVLEALGASKPNQRAIKEAVERATAPVAQQQQHGQQGMAQPSIMRGTSGPASPPSVSANSSSSLGSVGSGMGGGASYVYAPSPSPSSSPPPGVSLLPAFSINQSLTFLDISNNRIGCDIESVASALTCSNSALRELRLCLNDIGDVGANYLALALRHPLCALRSLDIGDNVVGPLGCKVLMGALEHNRALTKLDMSWNSLGQSGLGEGPRAVGRMLALNTTLRDLSLQSNAISDSGMRAICAGWADGLQCSALTALDLSINPLGGDGVRELATLLAHPACPLRSLALNRCQLSEDGCYALVQALPLNNRNLRRLALHGNHAIKADAAGQLIDAYSKSEALVELDIDDWPHISRDEALASAYRRARAAQFAHLVSSGSGLPLDLSLIVAEFQLDSKRKAITAAASSARDDTDV